MQDYRRRAAYRKIPKHMRRNTRARAYRHVRGRCAANPVKTLLALLCLTLAGFFFWVHPGYDPLPFSADTWARATDDERGHMVDDFLEQHEVEGMPQETLLALLGAPSRQVTVEEMVERHREGSEATEVTPWYGEDAPGRLHSATYRLGHRGFRAGAPMVFTYALHLTLRDGKVERAWISD